MRTKIPWVPEVFFSRGAGCFGVRHRPTDLRPSRVAATKHFSRWSVLRLHGNVWRQREKSVAPRVEDEVIFQKKKKVTVVNNDGLELFARKV